MDAKTDKLEKLVELSVELGEEIFSERTFQTQLQYIRASMLHIRKRLNKRARLIWPDEKGDSPDSPDESLGVAYRRELGRLEKRRQLLLGLYSSQKLSVSRLRLAVNRAKRALLLN